MSLSEPRHQVTRGDPHGKVVCVDFDARRLAETNFRRVMEALSAEGNHWHGYDTTGGEARSCLVLETSSFGCDAKELKQCMRDALVALEEDGVTIHTDSRTKATIDLSTQQAGMLRAKAQKWLQQRKAVDQRCEEPRFYTLMQPNSPSNPPRTL